MVFKMSSWSRGGGESSAYTIPTPGTDTNTHNTHLASSHPPYVINLLIPYKTFILVNIIIIIL